MKRIDSPNRAVDLFGAGKDGFKAAVPGVAPATELTPAWFNAVQEALVRTIEVAGMVPSGADLDQFTNAILLIVSGQVSGLAGSAPDLLNTIKELADAIANDPNFAVTMANALAGKERKFDSGTRMLFQQTAAPVGWTKVTTHDNKALRVVSGAAGSGGNLGFTDVFTSNYRTDDAALPVGEFYPTGGGTPVDVILAPVQAVNAYHSHGVTLSVQYVDVIIASKN